MRETKTIAFKMNRVSVGGLLSVVASAFLFSWYSIYPVIPVEFHSGCPHVRSATPSEN